MLVTEFKLYENREDVTLTAYVLAEKGELRGQGKRPAVLICPGGGYFNCSDREAEPVALAFAAMGYHAFVLRYSTYMEGAEGFVDLFSDLEVKEHLTHPTPVREIGMAMLLIREHAEEWMVDMDRVAVCGFSAGAHNSAMYGVYWDKPLITEFLGVEKEAIRPAALILGYTLSDYILLCDTKKNEMDEAFFRGSVKVFTGETQPSEEELIAISPARLVSEMTPPTFLWATSEDAMVPVQHSLRMAHALADHHIPFELHVFEEGDHGLSTATQASAVAWSQTNADAAKWVSLADKWLGKRFSLNLPEKTAFM
ncbi:MAG: alpha/beta hydrolase [Lachnospiraceae bacterium]|nr:alpha/beta hydrolase [Lachnospiraceae bacterium]